ncbi:hypothetical protein IA829_13895 [Listeria seeligeri]|uniref:hypothetical protein n=1 Tax=Listeria seeligeri TaxID=1640 RepID=UPI00188918CF|nr:hypothetical protein [Listeria seeligeri]MBF2477013.1 hypothetical protein [Listeria seeligeri]
MQLNEAELLAYKISDELKDNLGERISSSFSFSRIQEKPWIEFSIEFVAYNFFNIILNYDRGSFGCAIVNGDLAISLPNSQKWYDKADMNVFCKELQVQLELRIPDKFLEYYDWK